LAIGAVVLVVLVVGGTFVYIHFIEGPAPAPLAISSANTGAPSATAVPISGTWHPTSNSKVGYRVGENLFGQNATAVGRTNAVTGELVIDTKTVSAASFTVDLTKVSSDRTQRDAQFQGRIMDTSKYPTATFKLTTPIVLTSVPANGQIVSYKAVGDLTLHGKTQAVTFTLKAKRNGSTVDVNGSIPITFANWGIPNPSFGPVSTDDHGQLEFLLVFAKQGVWFSRGCSCDPVRSSRSWPRRSPRRASPAVVAAPTRRRRNWFRSARACAAPRG
jgi:polyisoprenoid-binding protein YceI